MTTWEVHDKFERPCNFIKLTHVPLCTEYVGELFTVDNTPNMFACHDEYYTEPLYSSNFTSMAANHRGLNYNFSTTETWIIDAARVGSNTRYANHAKEPDSNC